MRFTISAILSAVVGVISGVLLMELGYYPFVCLAVGAGVFLASGDYILNWIDKRK